MRGMIRLTKYMAACVALTTLFWIGVYAVMCFIMWEWQPIWPSGYQLYRATALVSAVVGAAIAWLRCPRS